MTELATLGIKVTSDEVSAATRRLDQLEAKAGKAERATDGLSVSAQNAAVAFGAMAAAAAATAAAFFVIKTKEFNKSISDLSAITGAVGKDLEFLTSKSLEFGATTTLSATQAADAFTLIASAKPDLLANVDALASVTKEAVTLAEAAGIMLPEAATALGASLNQFGMEANEASRVINVLAAGAKYGSSEIGATSQALDKAGIVAANAKISFEETNAAIQALATGNIKGAEAGTALRGVLLKLTTQSNDSFNPAIVGMATAFKNLAGASLTPAQELQLFGQEGSTAAKVLMQQSGTLADLTKSLTGTSTAYEQASTRTNNLDGDMLGLNSAIETQAILFGTKLDPSLRVLVQGFTSLISGSKKSGDEIRNMQRDAEDMAIGVAKVADVLGNAATGIALPFKLIGDAIGGVAAQISFIADGEFKLAMRAGSAATNQMTEDLKNLTDPEIANRFETLAIKMANANEGIRAASDKSADGGNDTYTAPTATGGTVTEMGLTTQDELQSQSLTSALAYFDALREMSLLHGADEEELAINKYQADLDRLYEHQQMLLDAGWTQIEADAEIKAAQEALEQDHLERMADISDAEMKRRIENEKKTGKLVNSAKGSALKYGLDLLRQFAKDNKAISLILTAISTAQAVIDIQTSAASATAQIVAYGEIEAAKMDAILPGSGTASRVKYAAAISAVQTMAAISSGLAIASGVVTAASTVSGSGSTPSTRSAGAESAGSFGGVDIPQAPQNETAQSPITNYYINGQIGSIDDLTGNYIIPAIQNATNNSSVVLFDNTSAQAQVLAG